jgi:hypothetical protein
MLLCHSSMKRLQGAALPAFTAVLHQHTRQLAEAALWQGLTWRHCDGCNMVAVWVGWSYLLLYALKQSDALACMSRNLLTWGPVISQSGRHASSLCASSCAWSRGAGLRWWCRFTHLHGLHCLSCCCDICSTCALVLHRSHCLHICAA